MKRLILFSLFLMQLSSKAQFYEWASQIPNGEGVDLVVDPSGNIYSVGVYNGNSGISKTNASGSSVWISNIVAGASPNSVGIASIDIDASYVYTTGSFHGTIDFSGVGAPNATISSSSSGGNLFILKTDAATGAFIWVKGIGNSTSYFVSGNTIDVNSQTANTSIYINGAFNGNVDFDPDAGTNFLNEPGPITGQGNFATFVLKLDHNGAFVWAKKLGGILPGSSVGPDDLVVDATSSSDVYIYSTGTYVGVTDFDPGVGVYPLGQAVSGGAGVAMYISKLKDIGNDAVFEWAKSIGGLSSGNSVDVFKMAVDHSCGNIYTIGEFYGTNDFDPNSSVFNLVSSSFSNSFLLKLKSDGNFVWVKKFEASPPNTISLTTIAVDNYEAVYLGGSFQGTVDLDPNSGTDMHTAVPESGSLLKLDILGNFVWAKETLPLNSIALDNDGGVYTTRAFGGTVDFDPDAGVAALTSSTTSDSYILKLKYNAPPVTLNLKFYIQGYFDPNLLEMVPVLMNQGVPGYGPLEVDEVFIELHKPNYPFDLMSTFTGILQTDGTITCAFPGWAFQNNYYIAIRHRNSIQTWSSQPILFGATTTYDFSTAASQAYDNNQIAVGGLVPPFTSAPFAIYSGDVNQDCNIDLIDVALTDIEIANFAFGYLPEDINGDGNVDILDLIFIEQNVIDFIFCRHPENCY